MDDSFFGFDTSTAPMDDDGGGGQIEEPSEEEYDALNDETFGSAMNGDWEQAHENMVRLTDNHNGPNGGDLNFDRRRNHQSGDVLDHVGRRHGPFINDKYPLTSGRTSPDLLNPNTLENFGRRNASFQSGPFTGSSGKSSPDLPNPKMMDNFARRNASLHSGHFTGSSGKSSPDALNARTMRRNDSDLEINFTAMDDVELRYHGDNSGMNGLLNLDSNVWAQKPLPQMTRKPNDDLFDNMPRGVMSPNGFMHGGGQFLRQQFRSPGLESQPAKPADMPKVPPMNKISTLEDIERNIILQQSAQKMQQQMQQQQQHMQHMQQQQHMMQLGNQGMKMGPPQSQSPQIEGQKQQHLQEQQQNIQQQHQTQQKAPPGFPHSRPPSALGHPLMPPPPSQPPMGGRLPPGFPMYTPALAAHLQQTGHGPMPPHPMMGQAGMPPNFMHAPQRPLPNQHLPVALNNFAMHPNFSSMRMPGGLHPAALLNAQQQPPRIPPLLPNGQVMNQPPHMNPMLNMMNMRLMQEIQQNHPLLQAGGRPMPPLGPMNPNGMQQQQLQQQLRNNGGKQNMHRRDGNINEDYDEYANLMSTRDKHWLIGIQLSQLNTDTPYIDDYYYTVNRERKAVLSGNVGHSQAHKDNQLNHPLIQPKGHAQLVLVQLGNKNGGRNGQHRERRSSEQNSSGGGNSGETKSYVFTPLKFENSLGKLQYGSVTAPRKIIDAEIMSVESAPGANDAANGGTNTSAQPPSHTVPIGEPTPSSQRKSRYVLLHIETMYRIVLKLEDLDNPNAIATILLKVKKENERMAALEQLESNNKDLDRPAESMRNRFAYEIEKKEDLLAKLIAGLTHDKVVAIMNVRKGKNLLKRIMPYIENEDIRWIVWLGVFSALQNVLKKDRDDVEGILYSLYPEFKKQIKSANFDVIVKISNSIPLHNKKSDIVLCSKFGISSLVCLILRAEDIYEANNDPTFDEARQVSWRQFLHNVASSLSRTIQNHTICAAIETNSIQPMMNHFSRFKDMKLDALFALISEAKQQIH